MFNDEKYPSCKVKNKDKFLENKDDYLYTRLKAKFCSVL